MTEISTNAFVPGHDDSIRDRIRFIVGITGTSKEMLALRIKPNGASTITMHWLAHVRMPDGPIASSGVTRFTVTRDKGKVYQLHLSEWEGIPPLKVTFTWAETSGCLVIRVIVDGVDSGKGLVFSYGLWPSLGYSQIAFFDR